MGGVKTFADITPDVGAIELIDMVREAIAQRDKALEQLARAKAALEALCGAHHGWHIGLGECVCPQHEQARAALRRIYE
jgi:hypothetical protein